jgi:hypothetical protein
MVLNIHKYNNTILNNSITIVNNCNDIVTILVIFDGFKERNKHLWTSSYDLR